MEGRAKKHPASVPAQGRLNAVDADACGQHPYSYARQGPMATKYASLTPYDYAFNNPVVFNDPTGDDPPQTINHSATYNEYYIGYTYDDRIDYFGMAVWHDAHGWRNQDQMAFWNRFMGYGSSMFGSQLFIKCPVSILHFQCDR